MKLSAVDFLDASEVEWLHDLVIAASGGASGLRDPGLLESAVAAPQTSAFGELAYPTLASMTGALAHRLAKNHAFVDGNKRTAAAVALAFLRANGVVVDYESEEWVECFEQLGSGELTVEELVALVAEAMGGDVDVESDE